MPPKRNWKIRLDDILDSIRKIMEFVEGQDYDRFRQDEKTVDAVIRNFEVIGEAAAQVPEEIKHRFSAIPWDEMKDMRNLLIHEYFGISLSTVWKTIQQDLPKLAEQLSAIDKGKKV